MSEDASVNTGAAQWPDEGSAYYAVRRMQTKLHRWAGEDPSRRFGDLYNLIYDPAFLRHAWQRVSSNAGARTPGVDRATVAWIETLVGVEVFLDHVRGSLKSGEFRPMEVRQVMIPKGKLGKLRKLGIPVLTDRCHQARVRNALEPEWEARFEPRSYGFRPGRGCHDAIEALFNTLCGKAARRVWVLDADLASAFDKISHDHLLAALGQFPARGLVRDWLKAGVFEAGKGFAPTGEGTPQGSLCSAEHKPPYEQHRVMRSADLTVLVSAIRRVEHCA